MMSQTRRQWLETHTHT